MKGKLIGLAAIGCIGLFATASDGRDVASPTNDLTVYGSIEKNLGAETLDDLGLNGAMSARFRISRVLRGKAPSPVVTIKYIAHTFLVTNREFRFRLRRADDGTYLVCANDSGIGYICK